VSGFQKEVLSGRIAGQAKSLVCNILRASSCGSIFYRDAAVSQARNYLKAETLCDLVPEKLVDTRNEGSTKKGQTQQHPPLILLKADSQ
jgi:hypothetical protein